MNGSIKVLIFILAYNAEKTICQTLDRIVPIEKYNLEVLVIDDASQDKTFTKVFAYKNNKKLQFKLTILKNSIIFTRNLFSFMYSSSSTL